MNLTGTRPIALITGATRPGRVGAACAEVFATAGFDLVLPTRSQAAPPNASALGQAGAATWSPTLDLADANALDAFSIDAARRLPRLDVLVLNASEYFSTPLPSLQIAETERLFRVNALAPLLLARGLAPLLAQSPRPGGGAIVAMSDVHALGGGGQTAQPRRDFIAYAMSKAALAEMIIVLAKELAPSVRVNGIAPGVVGFPETGFESDAAMQARYLERVPMRTAGTPANAAEAVRWLALDAVYCTGVILRVDGGRGLG